jgi:hypothetical protein
MRRERSRGAIMPGVGAGNHPSQPASGSSDGSTLTRHPAACHTARRAVFRRGRACSTCVATATIVSEVGKQSAGQVGTLLGEAIASAIVAANIRTCPAEGRTGVPTCLEEGRTTKNGISRSPHPTSECRETIRRKMENLSVNTVQTDPSRRIQSPESKEQKACNTEDGAET